MSRLIEELEHHLCALAGVFARPGVTDVHLQAGGHVWAGRRREEVRLPRAVRGLVARYLATWFEAPITAESPSFSDAAVELYGSLWRVTVLAPPVAREEVISFRRISSKPFALESFGVSPEQRELLLGALSSKRGILVIGQQGSGKTAFSSALLGRLLDASPELRVALIEDTPEILIPPECNHVALTTSPHRSFEDLVSEALRTGADLILIGEVRDRAVSHLVTAAITGHGALTTFHAASPRAAYERVRLLMQMGGHPLPDPFVVRAAFPLVAQMENRRLIHLHEESAP